MAAISASPGAPIHDESTWIPLITYLHHPPNHRLFWFAVDLFHAFGKAGHVAYWAHVGGVVAGFLVGLLFLKFNLIERTEMDHPDVLDLICISRTKNTDTN
jgi:hypothetical protein